MPEPVSNNAVVEANYGDTLCVYSFTGISEGLEPSDIHLKSWRYNTETEVWTALPDVDDFRGKIAAGASTVNNIIYLIGGYHVFDNFSEQTSPKVHRFDTDQNVWLEDGANVPVPIDDHVQAVWRDSLIYVITGWSQNTNVNDVQIYNPTNDTWVEGDAVPGVNSFESFGASGTIIGDTIYYYGGTSIFGFSFQATNDFRRGIINPDDPTDISWGLVDASDLPNGYRMACTNFGSEAIWIGGSDVSYNFDGIAYNGGAVVQPHQEIRTFERTTNTWNIFENSPYAVMDLRGIARESEDSWIIAGGMGMDREVLSSVYRITRATVSTLDTTRDLPQIYVSGDLLHISNLSGKEYSIVAFDLIGREFLPETRLAEETSIDISHWSTGIYVIQYRSDTGFLNSIKLFRP